VAFVSVLEVWFMSRRRVLVVSAHEPELPDWCTRTGLQQAQGRAIHDGATPARGTVARQATRSALTSTLALLAVGCGQVYLDRAGHSITSHAESRIVLSGLQRLQTVEFVG
jgi:hypothetical protein